MALECGKNEPLSDRTALHVEPWAHTHSKTLVTNHREPRWLGAPIGQPWSQSKMQWKPSFHELQEVFQEIYFRIYWIENNVRLRFQTCINKMQEEPQFHELQEVFLERTIKKEKVPKSVIC